LGIFQSSLVCIYYKGGSQSSQVIYIHEYFETSCSEEGYCYMYVLQALDKKNC
jgi:hypothetical protein